MLFIVFPNTSPKIQTSLCIGCILVSVVSINFSKKRSLVASKFLLLPELRDALRYYYHYYYCIALITLIAIPALDALVFQNKAQLKLRLSG